MNMSESNEQGRNEQRRKVVILAASVACMSAAAPALMRINHIAGAIWICIMATALAYVIAESAKVMRDRNR